MQRTQIIKLRVSQSEKEQAESKAKASGLSLSEFIRRQAIEIPSGLTPKRNKEKSLQLARIGNNLNQLARWANTYKSRIEGLEIILCLQEIYQSCQEPE